MKRVLADRRLASKLTPERRVAVEIRAAFLCLDAPRGHSSVAESEWNDPMYGFEEFRGWAMHYWYEHRKDAPPGERLRARNDAPTTDGALAGWLAREMFTQGVGDEPPPWAKEELAKIAAEP